MANTSSALEKQHRASPKALKTMQGAQKEQEGDEEVLLEEPKIKEEPQVERKRFFDKWAEKFKEFLDNAE